MAACETCEAAVIGAGPYGLSVAAHLRAAGADTRVFGDTMRFWKQQMPKGMLLRSAWEASHIAGPGKELTLDAYQAERGVPIDTPIPLTDFIAYGEWFQRQAVPDLDNRRVASVERDGARFRLVFEDGSELGAERVVLATGLSGFANVSPPFAGLPSELVSHSSDHADLGWLRGRRVLVVGGGQSALESAALLVELGADVEVVIRAPQVHWLTQRGFVTRLGPVYRLLYPPTDVGPPGLNWLIALPGLFRVLPRDMQTYTAQRTIRPAGAHWLPSRLREVPLRMAHSVRSVTAAGAALVVGLDDGSDRQVDHVLLATGYRIRVAGYSLLSPRIRETLVTIGTYPALGSGFESSIPGLHFVGASAAESFGPLMRFVAGTRYTARSVARAITRGRRGLARLGRRHGSEHEPALAGQRA